eukprot:Hpha_TRINITY_DN24526_c0_g1::TRINITY_DN24526_c0_g1_i1::g.172651::m.172651/K08657/TASP1; taspase, threonine aspartase, 1
MEYRWSIVVHAGAGNVTRASEPAFCRAMQAACEAAAKVLEEGRDLNCIRRAAARGCAALEAAEVTNAGVGSNLNLDGQVTLDGSLVDSGGAAVCMGAVPGVRETSRPCLSLLKSAEVRLSGGRIAPRVLAGAGAMDWVRENCPEFLAKGRETVTHDAQQRWTNARAFLDLDGGAHGAPKKRRVESEGQKEEEEPVKEEEILKEEEEPAKEEEIIKEETTEGATDGAEGGEVAEGRSE